MVQKRPCINYYVYRAMASSAGMAHPPVGATLSFDDTKHHLPDQLALGDDDGEDDNDLMNGQEGWVTWLCGAGSSLWPIIRREIVVLLTAVLLVILAAILSANAICPPSRCVFLHESISHWLAYVAYACVISIPGRIGDKAFFSFMAALGQMLTLSILNPIFFYVSAFEGAISRLWFLGMTWSLSDEFLDLRDSDAEVFDRIMQSLLMYQLLSIARQLALRVTMRTVLIGSFEQRIQDVLFQNLVLLTIGQKHEVDPATGRLVPVRRDVPLRELLRMYRTSDFRRKLDFVSKVRFRMYTKEGEILPLAKKDLVGHFAKVAYKKLVRLPPSVLVEVERKTEQITTIPEAYKGLFSATVQGQGDSLAAGVPLGTSTPYPLQPTPGPHVSSSTGGASGGSGQVSGGGSGSASSRSALVTGAAFPAADGAGDGGGTPWMDSGGATPSDDCYDVSSGSGTGLRGGGGGLARSPSHLHGGGAFPVSSSGSSSGSAANGRERAGTRLGDFFAQAKGAVTSAVDAVTGMQISRSTSSSTSAIGGNSRLRSRGMSAGGIDGSSSSSYLPTRSPNHDASAVGGKGLSASPGSMVAPPARAAVASFGASAPTLGSGASSGETSGRDGASGSSGAASRRALTSMTFSPPDQAQQSSPAPLTSSSEAPGPARPAVPSGASSSSGSVRTSDPWSQQGSVQMSQSETERASAASDVGSPQQPRQQRQQPQSTNFGQRPVTFNLNSELLSSDAGSAMASAVAGGVTGTRPRSASGGTGTSSPSIIAAADGPTTRMIASTSGRRGSLPGDSRSTGTISAFNRMFVHAAAGNSGRNSPAPDGNSGPSAGAPPTHMSSIGVTMGRMLRDQIRGVLQSYVPQEELEELELSRQQQLHPAVGHGVHMHHSHSAAANLDRPHATGTQSGGISGSSSVAAHGSGSGSDGGATALASNNSAVNQHTWGRGSRHPFHFISGGWHGTGSSSIGGGSGGAKGADHPSGSDSGASPPASASAAAGGSSASVPKPPKIYPKLRLAHFAAVIDPASGLDVEKAFGLFDTNADGFVEMPEFIQATESIYSELRSLKASLSGHQTVSTAMQSLLNVVFWLLLGFIVMLIFNVPVVQVYVSRGSNTLVG